MEEKSLNDRNDSENNFEKGRIAENSIQGSTEDSADIGKVSEIQQIRKGEKRAGLFFFLLMILEIPVSALIAFLQTKMPENGTIIALLGTQMYLLVGAILYAVINQLDWKEDLRIRKYKLSTFFLSVVLLICAAPMATWLNLLSQFFVKNEISLTALDVTQAVPPWLGVLLIGCLPGFIEELLYRGVICSVFRKRSVLTGIVVSALCFGLMHLNFNQMLYAIYLGVIFALLVEATGSLVSTMLLHMLFNAVNTLYLYVLPLVLKLLGEISTENAKAEMEALLNQPQTAADILPLFIGVTPFAVGGFVLVILLLKAIASINGREFTWKYILGDKQRREAVKPVTVCLILGFLFCLATAVLNAIGA